jgi:hypothetical protein
MWLADTWLAALPVMRKVAITSSIKAKSINQHGGTVMRVDRAALKHFITAVVATVLILFVEGVEKVILGYISLRQRRCNGNAHPSTEVISTRWRDTSRMTLIKSL